MALMGFVTSIAGVSLAGVFNLTLMLKIGLLFWFLHCIAHPINDYTDRGSDEIGRPNAPIPAGLLTLRQVRVIIYLDYVVAVILILILPLDLLTRILATIFLMMTFILSAPPIHTNARGILASVTVATAFVVAFIGGWVEAIGEGHVSLLIPPSLLIGSTHMMGKTIVDIVDIESDELSGRNTLPMQVGIKKSFYIAVLFGMLIVFLYVLTCFTGHLNIIYVFLGAVGSIITLIGLFRFREDYGKVLGRKYYGIFTLPIFIFPIAIILGSI